MSLLRPNTSVPLPEGTSSSWRFNVARFLVVVSLVWPFVNTSYFFPDVQVEVNFFLVFVAAGLAADLLFKDAWSILLVVGVVLLTALWGPENSGLRVVIGCVPCLFLICLHRHLLGQGQELVPPSIAYWTLVAFVVFSVFQYIDFNFFSVIPGWIKNGLAVVVPRYVDVPYDDFGVRGVQGWAAEPSGAALTCFSLSVIALHQDPGKRLRILSLFAVLTAFNRSVFAMVLLFFLCIAFTWKAKRRAYAIAGLACLLAVFGYFVLQSGRMGELRESVQVFGLSQETNRELFRFAQILYPLMSFPKMYNPTSLFGLDVEPIGLLPLLLGYGSVLGGLLYLRLVFRGLRLAHVESLPLAIGTIIVLSLMSPPDFVPAIVAMLYALTPRCEAVSATELHGMTPGHVECCQS